MKQLSINLLRYPQQVRTKKQGQTLPTTVTHATKHYESVDYKNKTIIIEDKLWKDISLTWHTLQRIFTKYICLFCSNSKDITSKDSNLKTVMVGKTVYN